jgi:hypothetical protein
MYCSHVIHRIPEENITFTLCEYASMPHADGFRFDNRAWEVNFADTEDFRLFGWKWFEKSRRCAPQV